MSGSRNPFRIDPLGGLRWLRNRFNPTRTLGNEPGHLGYAMLMPTAAATSTAPATIKAADHSQSKLIHPWRRIASPIHSYTASATSPAVASMAREWTAIAARLIARGGAPAGRV